MRGFTFFQTTFLAPAPPPVLILFYKLCNFTYPFSREPQAGEEVSISFRADCVKWPKNHFWKKPNRQKLNKPSNPRDYLETCRISRENKNILISTVIYLKSASFLACLHNADHVWIHLFNWNKITKNKSNPYQLLFPPPPFIKSQEAISLWFKEFSALP